MSRISVFNFISLNGFYKGENEDLSWHNHNNEESVAFSETNVQGDGILLFGRVTYDMMVSAWTSEELKQRFPKIAEGMNRKEKIVFSRKMKKADWQNTKVINGDIEEKMRKLKKEGNKDMVILGSGSIITQFANSGLIDEYQFLINPIVLAKGTPIFQGLNDNLRLKLTSTRIFKNGNIFVKYEVG